MPSDARSALENTIKLLDMEKQEDQLQYYEKMQQSSIAARRNTGNTWYPIIIKDSYYGVGEKLIIEVERPTHQDVDNLFQHGNVARLFSNYQNEGKDNPHIAGVIIASRANMLKLTFFADELPEWTATGKLGLDLMFDDTSYKEMEIAMKKALLAKNCRLAELRDVMVGIQVPQFQVTPQIQNNNLNESQLAALHLVMCAKDLAIIHGPPGTGKTTTLIQCILETLQGEEQVLVCAPSNAAVDLLTESLARLNTSVLRIGNSVRINASVALHSLETKIAAHADFKDIKALKKRAAEFRNMASKYKRNFGREERAQRKAISDEAKKLHAEAEQIEKFITDQIVASASVITCTLVGSAYYLIRDKIFSTVFIDEAGQALEPACWIPITRANRVIMAGDHLQLPPTVKFLEAARGGLSITLMEKCSNIPSVSVMLNTQYRMNETIMKFSNIKFYNNQLKAAGLVKNRVLNSLDGTPQLPLTFVDTAGCSFEEHMETGGSSLTNTHEANLLLMYLEQLAVYTNLLELSIGIISPYKAQVNLLKQVASTHQLLSEHKNLSVNTVDGFQGQERDMICISLVRSNANGEIGFLSDTRRMNVAMTRAKKKLIIIGDSATIGNDKFYSDFLKFAESENSYHSAWEFLNQ